MYKETEDENVVVFRAARGYRMAMDNNYRPAARPTKAKLKEYVSGNNWISPWGADNLWPCTVLDLLKACAPAQVCVEFLTALFYGNGPVVKQQDEKGIVTEVYNKDQQDFFRQTYLYKYLPAAATDYFILGNQFAQLIRNKNDKKPGFGYVANITAPFCRMGPWDKNTSGINDVFIHASWNAMPAKKEADRIMLIDPFDAEDLLAENPKADKFMWQTARYMPGNIFYGECPFHALVRNGTMDVFSEIPKIRKRRIKDSMFIKYHVRVNEAYWYLKCGGMEKGKTAWEAKTTKERKKMRAEFYTEIDNQLSGSANAFKSFFTPSYTSRDGTEIQLIVIEKLEMEVGESAAFGPDMMGATAEVVLAFGLPSAAVNTVLSDNKSRGGGSDIQESNNSIVARMPMIRHTMLEPVEFAMRNTFLGTNDEPLLLPNQWIDMDNQLLTRLDKNPNGIESTSKTEKAKP